jgi:oligosaccharyltransferase complex subunit epsilon
MPRKPTAAARSTTPQPGQPSASNGPTSVAKTNDAGAIAAHVWSNYLRRTPQRVKLLDTFMAFLVVVGVLQFVYCVLGGNYASPPFT